MMMLSYFWMSNKLGVLHQLLLAEWLSVVGGQGKCQEIEPSGATALQDWHCQASSVGCAIGREVHPLYKTKPGSERTLRLQWINSFMCYQIIRRKTTSLLLILQKNIIINRQSLKGKLLSHLYGNSSLLSCERWFLRRNNTWLLKHKYRKFWE